MIRSSLLPLLSTLLCLAAVSPPLAAQDDDVPGTARKTTAAEPDGLAPAAPEPSKKGPRKIAAPASDLSADPAERREKPDAGTDPAVPSQPKPRNKTAKVTEAAAESPPPAPDAAVRAYAAKQARKLNAAQRSALLDRVNTGDAAALKSLPGLTSAQLKGLRQARPFTEVADLITAPGFDSESFDALISWARQDVLPASPAPEAAPEVDRPVTPRPRKTPS